MKGEKAGERFVRDVIMPKASRQYGREMGWGNVFSLVTQPECGDCESRQCSTLSNGREHLELSVEGANNNVEVCIKKIVGRVDQCLLSTTKGEAKPQETITPELKEWMQNNDSTPAVRAGSAVLQ